MLDRDPLKPVLSEPHYAAIDRRTNIILKTVRQCIEQRKAQQLQNNPNPNINNNNKLDGDQGQILSDELPQQITSIDEIIIDDGF